MDGCHSSRYQIQGIATQTISLLTESPHRPNDGTDRSTEPTGSAYRPNHHEREFDRKHPVRFIRSIHRSGLITLPASSIRGADIPQPRPDTSRPGQNIPCIGPVSGIGPNASYLRTSILRVAAPTSSSRWTKYGPLATRLPLPSRPSSRRRSAMRRLPFLPARGRSWSCP